MNRKNNLRFQETDQKIRDYFLSALSDRAISKVTVQEICTHVGVNRSSFYLHYKDVYDLLEAIRREMGEELMEEFANAEVEPLHFFSEEYLLIVLRHMRKYAVFYRVYFANIGMTEIEKGYQTLFETVFKPYFRQLGMESEHQMEYHFTFAKTGFLAVVRQWLQYDCAETPEELMRIILSILPPGPKKLPDPEQ